MSSVEYLTPDSVRVCDLRVNLLLSLRRSVPLIRCCRFLFSTDPFCSEPDRPSRERTLWVRTSRMVSVYPTSCRYLKMHKHSFPSQWTGFLDVLDSTREDILGICQYFNVKLGSSSTFSVRLSVENFPLLNSEWEKQIQGDEKAWSGIVGKFLLSE